MYPSIPDEALVLRGAFVTEMSDDDFFDFCLGNDLVRIERLVNREIIILPPAGAAMSGLYGYLCFALLTWQRPHRQGRALGSSVGYQLPDGAVLSPDASWVSPERLATVTPEQLQKFPPLCPDFIIEVKSPSNRLPTLQAKMAQWLSNGVWLGFLIDTETETAYVYRPGQPTQTVRGFDNELSGEAVLPGFGLDLRELRG